MTTAPPRTSRSDVSPTRDDHLVRLRWGVRAALALGVSVSVIANVLHAADHPVSQAIAAWPPVALLVTVELVSRVPVHRRLLAAIRITATVAIAAIAARISYDHMAGVAARYGENGMTAKLLPISVDGLIVVASICLIELTSRIRGSHPAPDHPSPPHEIPQHIDVPPGQVVTAADQHPDRPTAAQPTAGSGHVRHMTADEPAHLSEDAAPDTSGGQTTVTDPTIGDRNHGGSRPHQPPAPPAEPFPHNGTGTRASAHVDVDPLGHPPNGFRTAQALIGPPPPPPAPSNTGHVRARSAEAEHDEPATGTPATARLTVSAEPSAAPAPAAEVASLPGAAGVEGAYQPVSADDALMYQSWCHAIANGRTPTGVELARATGRPDDRSGHGRRAIRRYRNTHTIAVTPNPTTADLGTADAPNDLTAPRDATGASAAHSQAASAAIEPPR